MAEETLTPDDLTWFSTRRRQVNDTYGLGLAQSQYQRSTATNEYERNRRNLMSQWDRVRRGITSPYAARGLLNSGIYQQGLGDYVQDRSRAFADLEGQHQDTLGGYGLGEQQLEQVRTGALGDLDEQQAARRATIAAQLRKVTY